MRISDWSSDVCSSDLWCGSHPGRNIPLALIPYWDINATIAELKRVSAKGCHAITFSDNPSLKGQPSIHNAHWNPLWAACADLAIVINIPKIGRASFRERVCQYV